MFGNSSGFCASQRMFHQLCWENIAKYALFVNEKIVLALQLRDSFQRMYTLYDVTVEYVNNNSYH
jgi:hypothetical protein